MAIRGVAQPEVIEVEVGLRLRMPERSEWRKALPWYQNHKILYYSEGISDGKTYDLSIIERMYSCLSAMGELYFIEAITADGWSAIGDVTLAEENFPIVIGDEEYWGKGIGSKVISALLKRASFIGMKRIRIPAIYHYNKRSQNLFIAAGFKVVYENESESSYEFNLK